MVERDSLSQAFRNGWADRFEFGLLRCEQLYRRPWTCRAAWRCGWELAHALCKLAGRPLRTGRKG